MQSEIDCAQLVQPTVALCVRVSENVFCACACTVHACVPGNVLHNADLAQTGDARQTVRPGLPGARPVRA